jgi:S-adenosylmethionine:tRNA ribosyltransferase-isomerase
LASFGGTPKIGSILIFNKLKARVVERHNEVISIKFLNKNYLSLIYKIGHTPLPPYIKTKNDFSKQYQTVYAKDVGSSAAPTAGLHFTKELMGKLKTNGVEIIEVTLHVGLGTFAPIRVENLEHHKMHCEYYEISKNSR